MKRFYVQYKDALGNWQDIGDAIHDRQAAEWTFDRNKALYKNTQMVEREDKVLKTCINKKD